MFAVVTSSMLLWCFGRLSKCKWKIHVDIMTLHWEWPQFNICTERKNTIQAANGSCSGERWREKLDSCLCVRTHTWVFQVHMQCKKKRKHTNKNNTLDIPGYHWQALLFMEMFFSSKTLSKTPLHYMILSLSQLV